MTSGSKRPLPIRVNIFASEETLEVPVLRDVMSDQSTWKMSWRPRVEDEEGLWIDVLIDFV
jgi:hypothetical protein